MEEGVVHHVTTTDLFKLVYLGIPLTLTPLSTHVEVSQSHLNDMFKHFESLKKASYKSKFAPQQIKKNV